VACVRSQKQILLEELSICRVSEDVEKSDLAQRWSRALLVPLNIYADRSTCG